jgi:hypothetical protein
VEAGKMKHGKKCGLCGKLFNGRFNYCPTCSLFLIRLDDTHLSIEAKQSIRAYVRKHGFVCNYTGILLDLKDPKSPWYCVFDHWVPGDDRKIVLTSFLINDMKTALSAAEFWDLVEELYNFKTYDTPMKKKKLRYWKGFFRDIREVKGPQRKCCICGKPFYVNANNEKYCRMCAELVWRMEIKKFPAATVKQVLDSIREHGYVCYYTGMPLERNPLSPWYVVLDHWMPGNPQKVVLTSALLNDMKSDLTEDEFWYFIKQLYCHHFKGKRFRKRRVGCWARIWAAGG